MAGGSWTGWLNAYNPDIYTYAHRSHTTSFLLRFSRNCTVDQLFVSLKCMKTRHQSNVLMSWLFWRLKVSPRARQIDYFPLSASRNVSVNFGNGASCWKKHERALKSESDLMTLKLPVLLSRRRKSSLDYDPGLCSLVFSAPYASNQ